MRQIKNIQTKEQIASLIREEILSGRILPGEELVQEKLAQMLGVSRMPIREALQTLEVEGFLERLPNRHMRVIEQKEEQIREIFSFMAKMEHHIICGIIRKREIAKENEIQGEFGREKQKVERGYISSEEELNLHILFGEIFGNAYLQQLYTKILQSYVWFAIKICEKDRMKYLQKILKSILISENEEILKNLSEYYDILAMSLIEHWRRNINEESGEN